MKKSKWNKHIDDAPLFEDVFLEITNVKTGDMFYDLGYRVPTKDGSDKVSFITLKSLSARSLDRESELKDWSIERWLDPTRV